MKRTAQVAVIGALLAMGVAQSYAQSPFVVSSLNIALTGFAGDSSSATAVKITNKDIINALSASNSVVFSKSAKLIIEVPADGGSPAFVVRDGATDTDVSSFFGIDSTSPIVASNGKTQYNITTYTFDSGTGVSFDLSGFTTDKIGTVTGKDTGKLTDVVTSSNSSVSGTGEVNSTSAVLKGTVSATGAKGEMH